MRKPRSSTPTAPNAPYVDFVPHPRYGRKPRLTGSNPQQQWSEPGAPLIMFHWHSSKETRIANTAIQADCSKQKITTMGVTHYFDELRTCATCKRRFIFFAEEQKHWYEELGFALDANCTRCVPCRKVEQAFDKARQRYETLSHVKVRTVEEALEMAECSLCLIEAGHFARAQTRRVRMLLNQTKEAKGERMQAKRNSLLARIEALEASPLP